MLYYENKVIYILLSKNKVKKESLILILVKNIVY